MTQATVRPDKSEYAPAFEPYVRLTPDGDIVATLISQLEDFSRLLRGLSDEQALATHPPYAWTIKQVVGHITDSERVFGHRALWLARNGGTPLASFDENAFMQATDFNHWPLAELHDEFVHLRQSHIGFSRHLMPAAWSRRGIVGEHSTTVRAIAYIMAGHAQHHFEILKQRVAN
jgi:hypothetical protein